MNKIIEMTFGSHLYGTNTPNSDKDFKGVFMPTVDQIFLGRIPKSLNSNTKKTKVEGVRNGPDDVDTEFYSLHYFIHLACEGETVALDMLHADPKHWARSFHEYPIWCELVAQRHRFYTKTLKSFVGYARRQAAKYGVKGSRLSDAKRVLEFLKSTYTMRRSSNGDCTARLRDVWENLPTGEHLSTEMTSQDLLYNVCGKLLSSKASIDHYIPMLDKFVDTYGHRAQQAAENQGIDWKAVSHAFRAAYQVKHILVDGGYTYPLPETYMILAVKRGTLDWFTQVQPALEAIMDEVEALSKQSTLPEKVDRTYWDNWLVKTVAEQLR